MNTEKLLSFFDKWIRDITDWNYNSMTRIREFWTWIEDIRKLITFIDVFNPFNYNFNSLRKVFHGIF